MLRKVLPGSDSQAAYAGDYSVHRQNATHRPDYSFQSKHLWGCTGVKDRCVSRLQVVLFLVKRNSEKNRAKIRNSPFGNPKKIAGHFCLMRACFMR